MNPRSEEIANQFTEWLRRYAPPRHLSGDGPAAQKEADELLRALISRAPAKGYADWCGMVLRRLSETAYGRTWPTVPDIIKAAADLSKSGSEVSDDAIEEAALARMESWFSKFRNQMPGHGRTDRTRKLIDRGVLANEREARFRGFDLTDEDSRKAHKQPWGRDEWKHHVGVIAKLRGISFAEANEVARAWESEGAAEVEPPQVGFKRMEVVE